MATPRKKSARGLQLDEIFLQSAQEQAGFWSDDASNAGPLSSRKDIVGHAAANARPANDDGRRPRQVRRPAPEFAGSRHFWAAAAGTVAFCGLFAALMGFGNGSAVAALLSDPARFPGFWASLAVIAGIQWMFALSAHRHAVQSEMLRQVMLAAQRMHEPSAMAEGAGRRINAAFDQMLADIDARMAMLDKKSAELADQLAAAMHHSTEAADINITNMRNIVEASETQREAVQRTGLMISTEILPVIAKLETTVLSLETISQSAGGILELIGNRLQQSTQDLKACLDGFNNANHNVAPEIEKRMLKFEASIAGLPEQLDATIGRLGPMSETITDAAILSTANIEVIDQLAKDITAALEQSRTMFGGVSSATAQIFQAALDSHVARFREMMESVVREEAARVSGLSRELDQLAGTAASVAERLQQPVTLVTAAADQALASVNEALGGLEGRIDTNIRNSIAELTDAADRIVSTVHHEVEASSISLQTRLAASSTDLMQRVSIDTARFEALIAETAERTSARIAAALKDLPAELAQRVDGEIAKVDGSLKGSVLALSEQMHVLAEEVPARMQVLARESLQGLEADLERSFENVAQRSEGLSELFRKNATEAAESVLQSYVDFIYLAVDRLRKELENANRSLAEEIGSALQPLPRSASVALVAPDAAPPPDAQSEPSSLS